MATNQLQELMNLFCIKTIHEKSQWASLKNEMSLVYCCQKKSVHSSYLQRGGGGGGCKEKPCSEEPIFFTTNSLVSLSLSLIRSHIITPPNPSWPKNTKHHNKVHRLVVTWWELVGVGLLMITRRSELSTFKVQPEGLGGRGAACLLACWGL